MINKNLLNKNKINLTQTIKIHTWGDGFIEGEIPLEDDVMEAAVPVEIIKDIKEIRIWPGRYSSSNVNYWLIYPSQCSWSISQYITSLYFYSVSRTQCSSSDSSGSSRSKYKFDISLLRSCSRVSRHCWQKEWRRGNVLGLA